MQASRINRTKKMKVTVMSTVKYIREAVDAKLDK